MRIKNQLAAVALLTAALLAGCGGGGGTATAGGGVGPGPGPGPANKNVALEWNRTALEAVKTAKPSPPVTARALALLHTAMYDATCYFHPSNYVTQVGAGGRRPVEEWTEANRKKAAAFAGFSMLNWLFPTQSASFTAALTGLGYDPAEANLGWDNPAGVGTNAAKLIQDARINDGSNQANGYADTTGYEPMNTPDEVVDASRWQPLRFSDGSTPGFATPHFGRVRPFSMADGSEARGAPPLTFGSPEYFAEMNELIDLSATLDDQKKAVAEFWAGRPGSVQPPGLWCEFAQWISARDEHTFDQDIVMFFILTNALMDAGIACWDTKRLYDTSRPITAIRTLYKDVTINAWGGPGQGTRPILGQNWTPYQPGWFPTPPFPEHASGHSTFSAAAAEVLRRFTGRDTFDYTAEIPAGSSQVEPGVAPASRVWLTFGTFSEAAESAGISRLYGGIHPRAGNEAGQIMGRFVGQKVWEKTRIYLTP